MPVPASDVPLPGFEGESSTEKRGPDSVDCPGADLSKELRAHKRSVARQENLIVLRQMCINI